MNMDDFSRHCEERSDEAIQLPSGAAASWIASLRLAMTGEWISDRIR